MDHAKWEKKAPYQSFYWGDFFDSTMSMHPDAAKAYLFLLGRAWQDGGCLRADDEFLSRASRCSTRQWKRVKEEVLERFQIDDHGRLFHPRTTQEITLVQQKRANKNRYRKPSDDKKTNENNGDDAANGSQNDLTRARSLTPAPTLPREDTESDTSSESKPPKTETDTNICPSPKKPEMNFDEFWSCWSLPGTKVGKPKAKENYEKAIKVGRVTHAEICDGVRRYMTWCQRTGQDRIKHPQGWITDGRWTDDLAIPAGNGVNGHGRNQRGDTSLDVFDRIVGTGAPAGPQPAQGNGSHQGQAPADGRRGEEDLQASLDRDQEIGRSGEIFGGTPCSLDGPPEFQDVPFADEEGVAISDRSELVFPDDQLL